MKTQFVKVRKGSAATFAIVIIVAIVGLLSVLARGTITRATGNAAWDTSRQMSAEKNIIGQLVKETVLGVSELQPTPALISDANLVFQTNLNQLNANQSGVLLTQTTGFDKFSIPTTWPAPAPFTRTLRSAGYLNDAPASGWMLGLSMMGPFFTDPVTSITSTTVSRTVNGVLNRNYSIEAQTIFVPISNFTIGYSTPSQGFVATESPRIIATWPGSSRSPVTPNSWNGKTNLLTATTQQFGGPNGDPAVSAYSIGTLETTPKLAYANNRELVSLCWTAWDFIWSKWFQLPLRYTIQEESRLCDISSFPDGEGKRAWMADSGIGSWIDPTLKIVDIEVGTINGPACVIDATGTGRIRLRAGQNSVSPIYLVFEGSRNGSNQTTIEIVESINRPVIIIAKNCAVSANYATIRGALWLDRSCRGIYDGTSNETNPALTIRGSYAFSAENPPSNLCPKVVEDQNALEAIAVISPIQAIVGVRVTND